MFGTICKTFVSSDKSFMDTHWFGFTREYMIATQVHQARWWCWWFSRRKPLRKGKKKKKRKKLVEVKRQLGLSLSGKSAEANRKLAVRLVTQVPRAGQF